MDDNGEITAGGFKVATPKRGTIAVIRWAKCRICGGRIRQHDRLKWFHIASGDEAC